MLVSSCKYASVGSRNKHGLHSKVPPKNQWKCRFVGLKIATGNRLMSANWYIFLQVHKIEAVKVHT